MKDIIESLINLLDTWGELTETILNALSLLCIIAGVILSLVQSYRFQKSTSMPHPMHTFFRRVFGGWLIVALEFQLAADIAGTIVSPSTAHLIELGAIAVIRTFLNYFLGKELADEREAVRSGNKKDKKEETDKQIHL